MWYIRSEKQEGRAWYTKLPFWSTTTKWKYVLHGQTAGSPCLLSGQSYIVLQVAEIRRHLEGTAGRRREHADSQASNGCRRWIRDMGNIWMVLAATQFKSVKIMEKFQLCTSIITYLLIYFTRSLYYVETSEWAQAQTTSQHCPAKAVFTAFLCIRKPQDDTQELSPVISLGWSISLLCICNTTASSEASCVSWLLVWLAKL